MGLLSQVKLAPKRFPVAPLTRGRSLGVPRLRAWTVLNAGISTVYTSPFMAFGTEVAAGAAITVAAGLTYSLDDAAFTATAGVRGTAKKIRVRLTSPAEYATLVALNLTVGVTAYTMSVTTRTNSDFPYILPFKVA